MRKMRKTGSMTALAVVLALGACSTVEDSWDYVFSDDSAADVATPAQGSGEADAVADAAAAQPIPQGLRGDQQPPDYGPGTRRQPTSTRSLNEEEAPAPQRSVVESVSPAASSEVVQKAPSASVTQPAATAVVAQPAAEAAVVRPPPSASVVQPGASGAVIQKAELAPPPAAPVPVAAPQAPAATPVAPPPAAIVAPAPAPASVQARTAPPPQPVMPLVPTTPVGEVYASQPLAGDVAPPVTDIAVAPRLRPPPAPSGVQSAVVPSDQLLLNPVGVPGGVPGGVLGGYDDLGTTVIGGDGRVLAQPGESMAHPMLTPDSYGFDMADNTRPVMMSGAETLVATIQFGRGSASLSANERRLLREVVQIQRQNGGVLQVVGHASSYTDDMSMDRHMMVNYTTSARRAEVVAAELRRLGAPRDAVLIVAQSDNAPIYREIMPSGEAGNRRAEIYLVN